MRWTMRKQFKTYEEQIKILLSGGLGIENLDKAKIILAQINDYNIINIYDTQCNYILSHLLKLGNLSSSFPVF